MGALATLLFAGLAAASPSPAAGAPSLALDAVRAFETVCLANRGAGADATLAAMQAFPGAAPRPDLPYGRQTLKIFVAGPLEFLIRRDRRGYGCFVAFEGDGLQALAALDAIAGLTVRGARNGPRRAYDWDVAGSRDDVRLVARSQHGGVLINLEVSE